MTSWPTNWVNWVTTFIEQLFTLWTCRLSTTRRRVELSCVAINTPLVYEVRDRFCAGPSSGIFRISETGRARRRGGGSGGGVWRGDFATPQKKNYVPKIIILGAFWRGYFLSHMCNNNAKPIFCAIRHDILRMFEDDNTTNYLLYTDLSQKFPVT